MLVVSTMVLFAIHWKRHKEDDTSIDGGDGETILTVVQQGDGGAVRLIVHVIHTTIAK